jgi:hypothetical protein
LPACNRCTVHRWLPASATACLKRLQTPGNATGNTYGQPVHMLRAFVMTCIAMMWAGPYCVLGCNPPFPPYQAYPGFCLLCHPATSMFCNTFPWLHAHELAPLLVGGRGEHEEIVLLHGLLKGRRFDANCMLVVNVRGQGVHALLGVPNLAGVRQPRCICLVWWVAPYWVSQSR